jgi:hypothetical protein
MSLENIIELTTVEETTAPPLDVPKVQEYLSAFIGKPVTIDYHDKKGTQAITSVLLAVDFPYSVKIALPTEGCSRFYAFLGSVGAIRSLHVEGNLVFSSDHIPIRYPTNHGTSWINKINELRKEAFGEDYIHQ